MRKIRVKNLKRAVGFRGKLTKDEKSKFRTIKSTYNKLSSGARISFVKLLYETDIKNFNKSQEPTIN